MSESIKSIASSIATELNVKLSQIEAAVQLLDNGDTVPFIARYRKEETGHLTDTQLRTLEDRLNYLRQLDERRKVILESIREQDKLTAELETLINNADNKTRLEDLYLPFRPKRHTKAQLAREAGLQPLADNLLANPELNPETEAEAFINAEKAVLDTKTALEGAQQILLEHFSEDATLLNELREYFWQNGYLKSKRSTSKNVPSKKTVTNKYSDYFDYSELLKKIPSHRALALFRGRREAVLQLALVLQDNEHYGPARIAEYFSIVDKKRPADSWLLETANLAWKIKLSTKLELELLARLREAGEEEAIKVFARNLRELLLAAPAGPRITIGLDPGIRSGIKVVVVDQTGKVLDYTTLYPFAPQNEWHQSIAELAKLASRYAVDLFSIGNGTGSRETERLVNDLITMYPDLKLSKMVVNEAGASVYSASALAADEFPDLDVTIRGAVSIARRLQDPLAELVKIEPKAIGVGQYQHDVNQSRLDNTLQAIIEDCVNFVGVDVNTASPYLLNRIAGLNETLAKNIVTYREANGAFSSREQLKEVPRMGDKSFQQSAGFLRIRNGDNPLDASAVHPEAYPIVEKIIATEKIELASLMGNKEKLQTIKPEQYVADRFSASTIRDIINELEKPGRDPRPEFKTAVFKEGVEEIAHLQIGMILEGVVSNVTNFGAFVDVGVHQDGLVHISEMQHRFISDPHQVVKAGDIVRVKVIELDIERRRISLSMKLEEKPVAEKINKPQSTPRKTQATAPAQNRQPYKKNNAPKKDTKEIKKPSFNNAMANALSRLKIGS